MVELTQRHVLLLKGVEEGKTYDQMAVTIGKSKTWAYKLMNELISDGYVIKGGVNKARARTLSEKGKKALNGITKHIHKNKVVTDKDAVFFPNIVRPGN